MTHPALNHMKGVEIDHNPGIPPSKQWLILLGRLNMIELLMAKTVRQWLLESQGWDKLTQFGSSSFRISADASLG